MVEWVSIIGFACLVVVIIKRSEILSKGELSIFGLFFGVIVGIILHRLGK